MQQGDCNAPATFQRLMTHLFRRFIGKFLHVYLDDIYIYSNSFEDHRSHIRQVLDVLRENSLYLNPSKVFLFADKLDCLGHIIEGGSIHPASDKMDQIKNWKTPRTLKEVQRFLGLVNYLRSFLPDIAKFTTPLANCCAGNASFEWTPLRDICFNHVKQIVANAPILSPIDASNPEPIWVICDASTSGVGAYYGQGPTWRTCKPAGFHSRKFSNAQRNYRTHEQELLAILQALMSWEDKLIGRKFTVVTDHKSLEFFQTQGRLSPRQSRWWEFLSRFDYETVYVKGHTNTIADLFSRYFQDRQDEIVPLHEMVNADRRLDPDGDELPAVRWMEISDYNTTANPSFMSNSSLRVYHSRLLREGMRSSYTNVVEASSFAIAPVESMVDTEEDPLTMDSGTNGRSLSEILGADIDVLKLCKHFYDSDDLIKPLLASQGFRDEFKLDGEVLYTRNNFSLWVPVIPRSAMTRGRRLTEIVMAEAHKVIGHLGRAKTFSYLARHFWWFGMSSDIGVFCKSCTTCQRNKTSNSRPTGLLKPLPLPRRPWESVGMDFVGPLPKSRGCDLLFVVIDRLTSMVHLIPTNTSVTATGVASLFVSNIVRLHGLPDSIVSDRDTRFTAKFWKELHHLLDIKLLMSTAYHPETDGATERANRTAVQILRSLVSSDQTDWVSKLPMVEFAINAGINASSGFSPFELNCGFVPRIGGFKNSDSEFAGVRNWIASARWNLLEAHDKIIGSRLKGEVYANARRSSPPRPYATGDRVYLSTENLSMPAGHVRKLCPKFIGPFPVSKVFDDSPNVQLDLPPSLSRRKIGPTFHIKLIRPFHPNDDSLFPNRAMETDYDFDLNSNEEWFVDEILSHRWSGRSLQLEVLWTLGDITWEPLANCSKLQALDEYLRLHGCRLPSQLPR